MNAEHTIQGQTYHFSPSVQIARAEMYGSGDRKVFVTGAVFTHGVLQRKDVDSTLLTFLGVPIQGRREDGGHALVLCEFEIPHSLARSMEFKHLADSSGEPDDTIRISY